jgi:hypothetical protein
MRFMMLVIPGGYAKAPPGTMPDPKLIENMIKFNEEMSTAGALVSLNGLQPPSAGVRVRFDGPAPRVVDGPFAEAKECVGGYWIIQVKSRDEAIEWAKRAPMLAGDQIEIRQIKEASDFPDEIHKKLQDFASKHPDVISELGD